MQCQLKLADKSFEIPNIKRIELLCETVVSRKMLSALPKSVEQNCAGINSIVNLAVFIFKSKEQLVSFFSDRGVCISFAIQYAKAESITELYTRISP